MARPYGEIRKLILGEHAALRTSLARLDARLADDSASTRDALVAQVQALFDQVRVHLTHEDEILKPALRWTDAWAQQHLDMMDEEHADQRATMTRLSQAAQVPFPAWREAIRHWAAELRADMDQEEVDFLPERPLRDDVPLATGPAPHPGRSAR